MGVATTGVKMFALHSSAYQTVFISEYALSNQVGQDDSCSSLNVSHVSLATVSLVQ